MFVSEAALSKEKDHVEDSLPRSLGLPNQERLIFKLPLPSDLPLRQLFIPVMENGFTPTEIFLSA
jgi:hypothetical protein